MTWQSKRSLRADLTRIREAILEVTNGAGEAVEGECHYLGHHGDRDLVDPTCPGLRCYLITALNSDPNIMDDQ